MSTLHYPEWMNVAEIEVIYKPKIKPMDRPKIESSKDAYALFLQSWDENKICLIEQFKMLLLNRANRVLGIHELSCGGISDTFADPRIIFAVAIKGAASGVILCHNHPSQNTVPSLQDENLTKALKECGKLLHIQILDHLIICGEGYYSFADEGLL